METLISKAFRCFFPVSTCCTHIVSREVCASIVLYSRFRFLQQPMVEHEIQLDYRFPALCREAQSFSGKSEDHGAGVLVHQWLE